MFNILFLPYDIKKTSSLNRKNSIQGRGCFARGTTLIPRLIIGALIKLFACGSNPLQPT